ncbi:MAG TPA: FG-GAP-like repeat-containing protein, partial [Verrucomicrobiae bacterium]|nr:FG-GAP-like repeat-containing protein [Verrucomicrobiae bacterium]
PRTNLTTGGGAFGVAVGDFNGDGRRDLAVANQNVDNVSLLLGNGDGSFGAPTNFAVGNAPRSLAVGDLNGDGKLDLAVLNAGGNNTLSVLLGVGNGSFGAALNYPTGGSDAYQVILADLNADGRLDAAVASYGSSRVSVLLNKGDGTFPGAGNYPAGNRPISVAAGDLDHDGLLDLATANYNGNDVTVLFPNNTELLAEDPPGSNIRSGLGRGNVSGGNDSDYWSFSGKGGDLVTFAIDTPGNPAGSSLAFTLEAPGGEVVGNFYSDYVGRGESSPFVLPVDGTYTVRIGFSYPYTGEYRLRATTVGPPVQIESENNDNPGQADVPSLVSAGGHQTATVLGYINASDPGDYFRLGNLAEGTLITLGVSRPLSSGLLSILGIYNSAGTPLAFSPVRGSNLSFTVPPAEGGTFYARVFSDDFSVAQPFGGTNGFALRFDGGSTYVSAPDSPSLRPTSLTLEGWFNFAAVGGLRVLAGKPLGTGGNNSYVLWHEGGRLHAGVGDATGFTEVNDLWSPQIGAWYHIAYTFDDVVNSQVIYVNGTPFASNSVTRATAYDEHAFLVGADSNNESVNGFFAGKIDEVRLWNTARTQTQIAAAMNQSLAGNVTGLAGYWRLDEGSGTTASDATPNANHGTLVNLPIWAPSGLANGQAAGLMAQYLVSLDLADTLPPSIVSNNLPAEGNTNALIVDRFTLGFSEDLNAASVTNSANYDLRAAGADGLFGTPDDPVYLVLCTGYNTGLSANYVLRDGPLQPGRYRFSAGTGLQDRLGNPMAAPHTRQFVIAGVGGFVFENRTNDSALTATSLSAAPAANPDGSFATSDSFAAANNPYFILAGHLNADT